MAPFKTPHQKKAAAITTLIGLVILLLFLVIGLSYYDPPITYGVAVNFGTTPKGGGVTPPKSAKTATPQPKETPVEKQATPPPKPTPKVAEKTITQERSEISIPKEKKEKPKPKTETKKTTTPKLTPPATTKPMVDESTKNILKNLVQAQEQKASTPSSEGDDTSIGDKGKITGNPYASSYYSTAGDGGTGTQYGLNGRSLQMRGKVVQECNEEGIVVVRITVDQNGRVIAAQPGVKGTTNAHPCLLTPAKATALKHQWNVDFNAPNKQIGFIVIQFKLGE